MVKLEIQLFEMIIVFTSTNHPGYLDTLNTYTVTGSGGLNSITYYIVVKF